MTLPIDLSFIHSCNSSFGQVCLSFFVWNIDYFFSICFSLYSLSFQTLLVECSSVQVLDSFCPFNPTSQISISSLMATSPFCVLTLPKFNPLAQASTLQNPFSRKTLDILIWMSDKSLNFCPEPKFSSSLSSPKLFLLHPFPFQTFKYLAPKCGVFFVFAPLYFIPKASENSADSTFKMHAESNISYTAPKLV